VRVLRLAVVLAVAVACGPRPPPRAPLMLTESGALTAPVTISGRELAFLVDTGATDTAINRATWSALGLPHGEPVTAGGASNVLRPAELVPVRSLRVAGREVRDTTVMVLDHIAQHEGRDLLDGILGHDVLGRFIVEIDTPRRRLILHERSSTAWRTPDLVAVAYRPALGTLIELTGAVDGVRCAIILDSGAGVSIASTRAAPGAKAQSAQGAIGSDSKRLVLAVAANRRVTIGDGAVVVAADQLHVADLPAFAALGLAGKPALLLGMDLLATFRVVIDPFARRVYFARAT
jgi:hypothetical protein